MQKLRVAVIGCGSVSVVHLPPIATWQWAELIAVCDVNEGRARRAGEKYQVPWYTDYNAVFALKPDVVHICTSHYTHAGIAIAAAKQGIHVLTEKPMATNLADADRMIAAAEENDVKLGVVFQNRYNAASKAMREVVERGDLGRLLGCRAFVTWFRPWEYYTNSDWKGTWREEGGGVLMSQAIHTIDLMQWLMGEVDYLQGSISNRFHDYIDVEDTAEATVFFKNGARGSIYACTNYSRDADVQLEVHGENGFVRLEMDRAVISLKGQAEYAVSENGTEQTAGKSYWGASHAKQIECFYRSIREDLPVKIDAWEGRKALEIVRAIYYSGSNGGCRVQFPFAEPAGFQPPSLTNANN